MTINLETLASSLLESPLFIVIIFSIAIVTSSLIGRFVKKGVELANHNLQIDGLRGFLAVGVFIHHLYINYHYVKTGHWVAPEVNYYNQVGQIAVAFFFMITGYLFFGKISRKEWKPDWRSLYIGRFFRLGPLYFVVVLVLIVASLATTNFILNGSIPSLFKKILGWLSFSLFYESRINGANTSLFIAGVNWTLRYEWMFYFCLPFLYLIVARFRVSVPSAIFSVAVFLLVIALACFGKPVNLLIVCYFVSGILASIVSRTRVAAWLAKPWIGVFPLGIVLAVGTLFHRSYELVPILLLTVAFVVIACGNSLFGLLRVRSIVWLGDVSYSTYLLHGLAISVLLRFVFSEGTTLEYVVLSVITTVVVVVVSSGSYLIIERPGMAIGKKWSQSRILRKG